LPKGSEQPSGSLWIPKRGCFQINRNRQHPASNVASNCLRVNQVRRRESHTDAHIYCEMNIGHYRDFKNVRGAPEAVNRLRHIPVHWCGQPTP
jgi:hypothetical protein